MNVLGSDSSFIFEIATANGHLEILKWFHKNGFIWIIQLVL